MSKKIDIYFQYPWKFPDSSYYKNILDYPPKGVAFVNYTKKENKFNVIGSSKKFLVMQKIKNLLRKFLEFLSLPNITFTLRNDFDLIHCAHCLSLNKKPWIVDTEVYDRVASTGKIAYSKLGKWIIKKSLESDYCKKIIAWSDDCKKTFEEAFPGNKKILSKIEVLHFALPKINFKRIPHKNVRVLFVARWFDAKGGRQTLEVFDRLSRKYPKTEFWFICPTPKEFRERYEKNKQIKIMDLVPQEILFKKIYPAVDIFFYPGFGDSYGFAVPEAMMFGLPIVSTKTFAKSELVEDGKNGFLVKLPSNWKGYADMSESFINELCKKTELLIKDKNLRRKMSKASRELAIKKFSIEKRNQKLYKIYLEAINGHGKHFK